MPGPPPIQSRYVAPEFRNAALLTIDLQHDFLDDGSAPIAGTSAVLPSVAELVAAFRRAGRPIVHVVHVYEDDGSNVDLCRRAEVEGGLRIVSPHTPGMELASELMPGDGQHLNAALLLSGAFQALGPLEWAMYKPRWGAFYQTALVVVAADAVSGIYDRGLQELANIGVAGMRRRTSASLSTARRRNRLTNSPRFVDRRQSRRSSSRYGPARPRACRRPASAGPPLQQ